MSGLPNASSWSHVPTLCVFLFIHGLLPLVYVIFLIRYRRQVSIQPEELRARLTLVNTVGLFLFLGVMPAPNFFRLFSSSAPALILFVWLLSSVRPLHQVLLNFFWILGITLALTEPWPLHVR